MRGSGAGCVFECWSAGCGRVERGRSVRWAWCLQEHNMHEDCGRQSERGTRTRVRAQLLRSLSAVLLILSAIPAYLSALFQF